MFIDSLFFLRWQDIVDILIVAFIIYNILLWTRNRNANKLLQGFIVILILYSISHFLQLYTIDWLMQKLAMIMLFVFLIVFQPELRQFLERLGQGTPFSNLWNKDEINDSVFSIQLIQNLIKVIDILAENKIGSIVVIERMNNLDSIKETGVELNAMFSSELLLSIFYGKNPLHDGAVVLTGNRIEAAGCLLPLTQTKLRDRSLGTRHRAALGLVELTDAIVLVTSEETGIISVAKDGKLYRKLNRKKLGEHLLSYLDIDIESPNLQEMPEGFHKFMDNIFGVFNKK
jgi:diadenylate cyclase